jgi:hypothetical protein
MLLRMSVPQLLAKDFREVLDYKNINTIETNPTNKNELWIGLSGLHKNSSNVVEAGVLRVLYSTDAGQVLDGLFQWSSPICG